MKTKLDYSNSVYTLFHHIFMVIVDGNGYGSPSSKPG